MTQPCQSTSVGQPVTKAWIMLALSGAMVAALVVRSLGVADVFLSDDMVLLGLNDGAYHARRAYYSFVNFPSILYFDPYMAFPDGSPVPWPPLYDWAIAGVARIFGSSTYVFESVAAWASAFFATLTVIPVYALGRCLLGARGGLAAAWIFAVLPASSLLSKVGYMDHHAAVGFLATCWLWSSIRETGDEPGRRIPRTLLHAAIVAALALVWAGSLLYIALAEGARLLVGGILWSHRERLQDQSAGALLAAVLVAPWVAVAPEPIGGAFSRAWRPETRPQGRALRAVAVTLVISLPLLAIPGLRDALATGSGFVSGADVWAQTNPEQQPLFSWNPRSLARSPAVRFGWFVFLVPVLPLLVASGLRRRDRREGVAVLLIWTTVLTALALRQVRFAHDLAMLSSVVFAGTLLALRGQLVRVLNGRAASLAVFALSILLLWPAFSEVYAPRARRALQQHRLGDAREAARLSPMESELRFGRSVRLATPETSGYLDDRITPEYGLLVHATFGHTFLYTAQRPVSANNFGPYLDEGKFKDVTRFYKEVDLDQALAALDRLGSRFVVTAAAAFVAPMPYAQRLHRGDGFLGGDPVCGACFRLVTEGPERGTPSRAMFASRPKFEFVPYKLFERVAGAQIEVAARPGVTVEVELDLQTTIGRSFVFVTGAQAGEDGWARLRVPYATDITPPVHARGRYRVRVGESVQLLSVTDEQVRAGATLSLPALDAGPGDRNVANGRKPASD
ncbi:MAG: glycosyltransferase family 39 protein [Deltaproteobacteria bacterium]|nr:glycosyltransferase family 39 protein [Deltaproteobacteria bacterium]